MILLSAHRDTIRSHYRLDYENGKYIGLLDNAIGVLVVNGLFISEPVLCGLERAGRIKVCFGDSEEWGTITEMPKLKKDDIVLVVDVCCGKQYDNIDISLENISGFNKKKVNELKENLEWEGFRIKTKMFDGNPEDEDEAFFWNRIGQRVISFIIPIKCQGKTGWHIDNCTISIENVVKSQQILKRLINYLL